MHIKQNVLMIRSITDAWGQEKIREGHGIKKVIK